MGTVPLAFEEVIGVPAAPQSSPVACQVGGHLRAGTGATAVVAASTELGPVPPIALEAPRLLTAAPLLAVPVDVRAAMDVVAQVGLDVAQGVARAAFQDWSSVEPCHRTRGDCYFGRSQRPGIPDLCDAAVRLATVVTVYFTSTLLVDG